MNQARGQPRHAEAFSPIRGFSEAENLAVTVRSAYWDRSRRSVLDTLQAGWLCLCPSAAIRPA